MNISRKYRERNGCLVLLQDKEDGGQWIYRIWYSPHVDQLPHCLGKKRDELHPIMDNVLDSNKPIMSECK